MQRVLAPRGILLIAVVFGTLACDRITGPEGRARVEVSPAAVELMVGDAAWLTATVYDDDGRVVPGAEVSWRRAPESSSDVYTVEIAPAQTASRIRGTGPGELTIVAENGGLADTVRVRVQGHEVSFAEVDAGQSFLTCGLDGGGSAYCWGSQYAGVYPTGGESVTRTYTPAPVPGGTVFASLGAGAQFACGLTRDGEALCWGLGEVGVLGNGYKAYPPPNRLGSTAPIPVEGGLRFASLSVGSFHSCGLTREGAAYCWGSDLYGQLGDGPAADNCDDEPCSRVPVRVAGGQSFRLLSAGGAHTCGITTDGATYCWGMNDQEQLGNASVTHLCKDTLSSYHCSRVPVPVQDAPVFQALVAGGAHTCALATEGSAYCWGDNRVGALGTGEMPINSAQPLPISGGLTFGSLASGGAYTCGLTPGGQAYCWGSNGYAATGSETREHCIVGNTAFECNRTPGPVSGGLTFRSLSGGGLHACGIATSGIPHCWGNNSDGQLGNGDGLVRKSTQPLPVYGSR